MKLLHGTCLVLLFCPTGCAEQLEASPDGEGDVGAVIGKADGGLSLCELGAIVRLLNERTTTVETLEAPGFSILEVDQLGTERPANQLGSIGAIEPIPTPTVTPRECALDCRADHRDCRAPLREDQRECAAFCSAQRASDVESCAGLSDRERGQCRRAAGAAARACLGACREAQQAALDSCRAVYETCRADCTDL